MGFGVLEYGVDCFVAFRVQGCKGFGFWNTALIVLLLLGFRGVRVLGSGIRCCLFL